MDRRLIKLATIAVALSAPLLLHAQRQRVPPVFAENSITLTGAVVQLLAMNPQTLLILDANNQDGESVRWQAILPSQQVLRGCYGWSNNTLKPGDSILITGHAAKSGAPLITLLQGDSEMFASNGKTLFAGARSARLRAGATCPTPR